MDDDMEDDSSGVGWKSKKEDILRKTLKKDNNPKGRCNFDAIHKQKIDAKLVKFNNGKNSVDKMEVNYDLIEKNVEYKEPKAGSSKNSQIGHNVEALKSKVVDNRKNENEDNLTKEQITNIIHGFSHKETTNVEKSQEILNYQPNDIGPYNVYVKKNIFEMNESINNIIVSRQLISLKINNFYDVKKVSRHIIKVTFNNYKDANNLVNSTEMLKNVNLKAFIPGKFVFKTGIIFGIPTDIPDEELLNELTQVKEDMVTGIKRITKIIKENDIEKIIPTARVKVFFRSKQLPEYVSIYRCRTNVKFFIPTLRQCYKCCRFGHISANCKSNTPKCLRCAMQHSGECNNPLSCANCKEQHMANSKDCPAKIKRELIDKVMILESLTFQEAQNKIGNRYGNRFEMLENYEEEFPTLNRYEKRRISPTETVNRLVTRNLAFNEAVKNKKGQPKKDIILMQGSPVNIEPSNPIMENPHKTSDTEKLINVMKDKCQNFQKTTNEENETINELSRIIDVIQKQIYRSRFSQNLNSCNKDGNPTNKY